MQDRGDNDIQAVEALIDRGEAGQALRCLGPLLQTPPGDGRVFRAAGRALNNLGRLDEAVDAYRRAIDIDPDDIEAFSSLGHVLARKQDNAAAETAWRQALCLNPDDLRSLKGMGRLLAATRRLDDAIRCLLRVTDLAPEDAENWLNLAELLQFRDRLAEATAACRKAAELAPERPDVNAALGQLLQSMGEVEAAEHAYASALQHDPDLKEAAAGRALCLEVMGQRDAGLQALAPFLEESDRPSVVDYAAGRLLAGAGRYDEGLIHLQRAVASSHAERRRNPGPWYALGHVLEKMGRYDEAFDAWHQANRLKPVAFDPDAFAQRVQAIIDWHTRERMASWQTGPLKAGESRPLFIVGMPRSGTTLVEQILACHSGVQAGGERLILETMAARLWNQAQRLGPRDDTDALLLRRKWQSAVGQLRPETLFYTDKFPGNFMHLGLARRLLPEMRVIWCRRNPADTAVSIFSNDFNRNILPWANRLEHIAAVWKAQEDLMSHWQQTMDIPVIQVRYESLVEDFEYQVRNMLNALELTWEPACLKFHESGRLANTASFDQVRRPVYASSIGRYSRFGHNLDPFLAALRS